jgi:hypothetical protein
MPFRGPRLPSSLPLAAIEFLCWGLLPRMRKLSLFLFLCGLRVHWGMHDGQAVQWPWRSFAGVLRLSVSLLLIYSGKLRQSVGLRNGPLVPEGYSRKSYLLECRVLRLPPGPSGL